MPAIQRRFLPLLAPAAIALVSVLGGACAGTPASSSLRASVTGILRPSRPNGPVEGALVVLATEDEYRGPRTGREQMPPTRRRTVADASGRFRSDSVPAGKYHLMVRRVGYVPFDTLLNVSIRASTLDLSLAEDGQSISVP